MDSLWKLILYKLCKPSKAGKQPDPTPQTSPTGPKGHFLITVTVTPSPKALLCPGPTHKKIPLISEQENPPIPELPKLRTYNSTNPHSGNLCPALQPPLGGNPI